MTTIAVRHSTLEMASDSLISGDGFSYNAQKFRKLRSSVIGAAGDWHHVLQFFDRLKKKKPLDADCDVCAIELRKDGIYVYEGTIIPTKIQQDFYAIGTGAGYAIACMHYGHSPKDAVELAALYDPNTKGPIEVVTLGRARGKSRSK